MNDKQPEFLLFHRFSLRQESLAAIGFLLFLIFLRTRVLFNLSQGFLGGYEYDAGLYVWLVQSNLRDLFSEPWFDTKSFFPYGNSLAWSDNFILPSVAAGFLKLIGFSFASAYNLVFLFTLFLNGFLTYLCCYYLRGLRAVAAVPGVFLVCYGFLSAHLGHPQLQFVFFFPLLVILFFQFLQSPTWPRALLLCLPITLGFLCSVYIAIFLALSLFALSIGTLIARPALATKEHALKFGTGAAIGLILLVPFVLPYLSVQASFGERGIYEPGAFAPSIISFLSAPKLSMLYHWLSSLGTAETQLFPGISVGVLIVLSIIRLTDAPSFRRYRRYLSGILLAIAILSISQPLHWLLSYPLSLCLWALLAAAAFFLHVLGKAERAIGVNYFTNRSLIGVFLFVAIFFLVLSFGPLRSDTSWGALSPFSFFYHGFPGVSAVRAIGRFAIPLFFFVMLASCFALPEFMRRHPKGKYAPFFLVALIALENYQLAYPFEGITQRPNAFSRLDTVQEKNIAIIALPFTDTLNEQQQVKHWSQFAKQNVNYMNWNFPSNTYLVNGYSGMRSWIMTNFPGKLQNFPDERSLATLAQIPNLKKIILASSSFKEAEVLEKIKSFPELSQLQSFGDSMLLDFSPLTELKTKTGYLLRVPSKTPGKLFLQLRTEQSAKSPLKVRVYIDKYFEHDSYTELAVPADTEWHELGFAMPQTSEQVIPYVVRFETQEGNRLFLGSREFIPSES
ncbi:MAG: hypothetical protein KDD62_03395 [Bdellovibrionales bacterium]|nr:hypothetical protein [Bdellovibrionales bacterium]